MSNAYPELRNIFLNTIIDFLVPYKISLKQKYFSKHLSPLSTVLYDSEAYPDISKSSIKVVVASSVVTESKSECEIGEPYSNSTQNSNIRDNKIVNGMNPSPPLRYM